MRTNTNKGMTLVETIISIGILSLFIITAISFILFTMRAQKDVETTSGMHSSAHFVLSNIQRYFEDADAISNISQGNNNSELVLDYPASVSYSQVTFTSQDGNLYVQEDSGDVRQLNIDPIDISNVTFTNLSYTDTITVRIEFSVSNPDNPDVIPIDYYSSFTIDA